MRKKKPCEHGRMGKENMQFPNEVKRTMRRIGVTKEEEEALCELLSGNFIPEPLNIKENKLKLTEMVSEMRKTMKLLK